MKNYLFEEKMVGKMIQDHRVCWVNGVGFRKHLNTGPDVLRLLPIKL